jgi:dihydropteroate synthase
MRNDDTSPLIMGILNVTPDSFSDGGLFLKADAAVSQAEKLVADGADILDIGGQSTRPGAEKVEMQAEMDRVMPVIERIRKGMEIRLSIDTDKVEVAREALKLGVTLINDISAGQNFEMGSLVNQTGVDIILMHMRGSPATMQVHPLYSRGVVSEVKEFLVSRVRAFTEAGVAPERIWVDPGIGFGKALSHNLELLRDLSQLVGIGHKLVVGTSRKSFLGQVVGVPQLEYDLREPGTLASNLWAYHKGANVFRVHDVGAMKRALTTWRGIENGR